MSLREDEYEAVLYVQTLLESVRGKVQESDLNTQRLLEWVNFARVEIGSYGNSILLLFQGSTYERDDFEVVGEVNSVLEHIFRLDDYPEAILESAVGRVTRESGEMPNPVKWTGGTYNIDRGTHFIKITYDYHRPFMLNHAIFRLTSKNTLQHGISPFYCLSYRRILRDWYEY